jgi:small conductance mechanosensitive channel
MFNRSFRSIILLAFALALLGGTAYAQPQPDVPEPSPSATQVILDDIERLRLEYGELAAQLPERQGDERAVLVVQMRNRLLEFMRQVEKLVANVLAQDGSSPDDARFAKKTRALVLELDEKIPPFLDSIHERGSEFRSSLPDAAEDLKVKLKVQIRDIEDILDEVFRFYLAHLGHLESLGLPTDATREQLGTSLEKRADTVAGRLELSHQRLERARQQADATPEDAALSEVARTLNEQLDAIASSLWTTCDLMDELELETAEYRQLLIQATGEITSDILDTEVAVGLLLQAKEGLQEWFERKGPPLLGRLGVFAAILAFFWVLGIAARRTVKRFIGRSSTNTSELAGGIMIGVASRVVVGIGFFVALSQVGIDVTALLTGLGIAGFIVGFALQDTLGNFASGTMILIYRPFDVGDVIEAGTVMGTVDSMNLVSTTFLTFDNQKLVVPNSKIWGDVIRNVTAQKARRVDLSFGLSHDTDIVQAEELFASIMQQHPKVLDEPEAAIKINKLTDSAIEFLVRPWAKREDYWEVYWDLTREIAIRLDREGIQLGIPRRDVQISRDSATSSDAG